MRGKPRQAHTPQREVIAAAKLREIFAARGDDLRDHNATRIIEQARKHNDRSRGITIADRKAIEAARDIKEHGYVIGDRDRLIVKQAVEKLAQAPSRTDWDRDLFAWGRQILKG